MKDFPEWFERFADELTIAINLVSAAGEAMADEKMKPRTAMAHLSAACKIIHSAGKSIEKWTKNK